ncbi:hypothetical protein pipiens_003242 [Culex pipiens pipiens]|uniref:Chitin-binding type-2 domain-containing protein n=2 Tax=Culex pipiens pipiens TaxID=38569 RepID=A0ABD1D1D8_CULPP
MPLIMILVCGVDSSMRRFRPLVAGRFPPLEPRHPVWSQGQLRWWLRLLWWFPELELPESPEIVPGVVDTRCPRMDDPINPTHLPVNGDCRKFMKCYGGRAYEHECPAGLEFGIQVNRCDYPELARCSFNYGW